MIVTEYEYVCDLHCYVGEVTCAACLAEVDDWALDDHASKAGDVGRVRLAIGELNGIMAHTLDDDAEALRLGAVYAARVVDAIARASK